MTRHHYWLICLGALLLAIGRVSLGLLESWHNLPPSFGTLVGSGDPDSWMRLTLVRDWLSGGSWYDHHLPRSNAPFLATTSPWTRPLDLAIALVAQLQPADIPLDTRLLRAALIMPLLWITLLLTGMFRAVRYLTPLPVAPFITMVMIVASTFMLNYFGPGNADHHALLAGLFAWVLAGLLGPHTPSRMAVTGLLLGLMLWISPEALTLIGAIYGWFGLRWLAGHRAAAAPLAALALSTALTSALAVMIERPPAAWSLPVYDSISIVYVSILSLTALIAVVLVRLAPSRFSARAAIAGAACLLLAAAIYALYPLAFRGPLAEADAFIFTDFLPYISEAIPLYKKSTAFIIGASIQPLAALAICLLCYRMRHQGSLFATPQLLLAYLLSITFALITYQLRWYYYFYPIVALILTPFICALLEPDAPQFVGRIPARWIAHAPEWKRTAIRVPALLLLLALPYVFLLLNNNHSPEDKARNSCHTISRTLIQSGTLNTLFAPATLVAPADLGGELLFFTPHRIIASNYHREGAGLRYLADVYTISDAPALRTHLAARGVTALLVCPTHLKTDGLLTRLQRGEAVPPSWLIPIAYPSVPADEKHSDPPPPHSAPLLLRVQP